jgi:hypothetical protein
MLAERPSAASDSRTSDTAEATSYLGDPYLGDPAGPAASPAGKGTVAGPGPRSARKKRGLLRRHGLLIPAAGLAILLVVVVWGAAKVMNPQGTGASSLYTSIDGLGSSGSVRLLAQEQKTLVEMTAAAKTLAVGSKPTTANLQAIIAASQITSDPSSGTSTSGTTGGTGITTTPPPSNPTAAEATAQSMLASFGFGSDQYTCLYDLWNRESGWNVYAENPSSGAYGIPQSLPGEKMASAGADWQTNAATQISWGLGYIKSVYGTPCNAWGNEEAYGYY